MNWELTRDIVATIVAFALFLLFWVLLPWHSLEHKKIGWRLVGVVISVGLFVWLIVR